MKMTVYACDFRALQLIIGFDYVVIEEKYDSKFLVGREVTPWQNHLFRYDQ